MEWISVNDRLPELHHSVLISDGMGFYVATLLKNCGENEWKISCDCADIERHYGIEVTHWIPLPSPPKES